LRKRWIDESYRLLAHKQPVALLDKRGLPDKSSKKPAKGEPSGEPAGTQGNLGQRTV
jgi:hypothetical protein